MNNFIGIDPGLSGAICLMSGNNVLIYDIPVLEYKIAGGKTRRELNIGAFATIIRKVNGVAWLEALNGRPGRGATEFRIGENYGMIKAALVLTGTPYKTVSPQKWKAHYGLKKDKELSRQKAIELFPDKAKMFSRKKDNDRAEAALIALYGSKMEQIKNEI